LGQRHSQLQCTASFFTKEQQGMDQPVLIHKRRQLMFHGLLAWYGLELHPAKLGEYQILG
jgi:hypothetical protein